MTKTQTYNKIRRIQKELNDFSSNWWGEKIIDKFQAMNAEELDAWKSKKLEEIELSYKKLV